MSVPVDQMQGALAAVEAGVQAASNQPEIAQAELDEVKAINEEYNVARSFDEEARKQYNRDRRYAQGVADPSWASDANIIGAFIDILVAFLFARNPDVSARPAPRAGNQPDKNMQMFSETLQIVISRLWKDAKLKKRMRKVVRSVLSVGPGWIKALVYSDSRTNPTVQKELHDTRDQLEQIEAIKKTLTAGEGYDGTYESQITALNNQIQGLQANVEQIVKRGLCIDSLRAEDVQISLDVTSLEDYTDADWISNDLYVRKDKLRAQFPRLTDEDCRQAVLYHQQQTGSADPNAIHNSSRDSVSAEGQFTKSTTPTTNLTLGGKEKPVEFVKVVELWDHRDNLIKTFVDGVQRFARDKYPPPQASTRFYPYFYFAFYETDGSRHPQSLSWRMRKLQDEYSQTRSAGRLTKERMIPGIVFNAGQLDEKEVEKLKKSEHMEYIPLNPTTQDMALDKIITAKPLPHIDPALFDTLPVQRDMEVMSGVQEAKSSSAGRTGDKTATEAEIEESGFSARTGTDRDIMEDTLTELAQYTAELSIQSLPISYVQRIAGPLAFWPGPDDTTGQPGMDVQDVLLLLDVEIAAGTTGKPQARADKEAWATLLPMVERFIALIQQLDMTNPPMAKSYRTLLRETAKRLDDRMDIDSLIPPPPQLDPATGLPVGAAPMGAPGPGAAAPGLGAPPVGNGAVNNPATIPTPTPAAPAAV